MASQNGNFKFLGSMNRKLEAPQENDMSIFDVLIPARRKQKIQAQQIYVNHEHSVKSHSTDARDKAHQKPETKIISGYDGEKIF